MVLDSHARAHCVGDLLIQLRVFLEISVLKLSELNQICCRNVISLYRFLQRKQIYPSILVRRRILTIYSKNIKSIFHDYKFKDQATKIRFSSISFKDFVHLKQME